MQAALKPAREALPSTFFGVGVLAMPGKTEESVGVQRAKPAAPPATNGGGGIDCGHTLIARNSRHFGVKAGRRPASSGGVMRVPGAQSQGKGAVCRSVN